MMTAINKTNWLMNLADPPHAYLFGFIQADGHLRRIKGLKGSIAIELGWQDKCLLERFSEVIPYYSSVTKRTRKTNFKDAHKSAQWTAYSLEFRQQLIALGMPEGQKSGVIAPPQVNFSKPDYYRGIIDADGALGLTANEFPFLSLTTDSEALAQGFIGFIEEVTGKLKTTTRNTRDGIYNVAVYKEDAQALVTTMYYEGCLGLPRKIEKAKQVIEWIRPLSMKKIDNRKFWSSKEDSFILNHSIKDSMSTLGRSEKSISLRLWRLRNNPGKIKENGKHNLQSY